MPEEAGQRSSWKLTHLLSEQTGSAVDRVGSVGLAASERLEVVKLETGIDATQVEQARKSAAERRAMWVRSTIVIVIVAFMAGYLGLTYHQSQENLRMAKSFVTIGEFAEAINHYKAYLSENPNKSKIKLELALLLQRNDNDRKALRILKTLNNDLNYSNDNDLKNEVTSLLYLQYAKLFDDCKLKADTCMKEKKYSEGRSYYVEQQEYIKGQLENGPGLKTATATVEPADIAKQIWNYQAVENIAHIALTYWLEGDSVKTYKVITQIPDWCLTVGTRECLNQRYSLFASLVENIAFETFNKKDWEQARKHYQCALVVRKKDSSEFSKMIIPVLKFDIGLTYYYQKMYSKAKQVFAEIKSDFPDYENDYVRTMLMECDKIEVDKSDFS